MATFSLGGLSAYTEENKADIVTKSILGARKWDLSMFVQVSNQQ